MRKSEAYAELRKRYEAIDYEISIKDFFVQNKSYCTRHKITLRGLQLYSSKYSGKTKRKLEEKIEKKIKKVEAEILQDKKTEIENLVNNKIELANRVLQEIAKTAFVNIKDLYHSDGRLKQIHELDDETGAAIASIKVSQKAGAMKLSFGDDTEPAEHIAEQVTEIKLWDKGKFVDMINKHVGIYERDNEQKKDEVSQQNIILTAEEVQKLLFCKDVSQADKK